MNQTLPFNYQTLPIQNQIQNGLLNQNSANNYNPIQNSSGLDYKPFGIEKLSSVMGQTFLLSSLEHINTIPLPRGTDQQIFLVNNDEKIYLRTSDNSIGIIGYKQDYVTSLIKELKQAQGQLQEIYQEVLKSEQVENSENTLSKEINESAYENQIKRLEEKVDELFTIIKTQKGEKQNGPSKNDKALAAISELA